MIDKIVTRKIVRTEVIAYVESSTTAGLYYKVTGDMNNLKCSCIGFMHHERCKHCKEVLEQLQEGN